MPPPEDGLVRIDLSGALLQVLEMAINDSNVGIEVLSPTVFTWRRAGVLGGAGTLNQAKGAAGLYAFVCDGRPLYVGKAGGLKPGERSRWANDIKTRLYEHWKTGPFRGLVSMSSSTIEIWFVNLAAGGADIWERDIERIENDL